MKVVRKVLVLIELEGDEEIAAVANCLYYGADELIKRESSSPTAVKQAGMARVVASELENATA